MPTKEPLRGLPRWFDALCAGMGLALGLPVMAAAGLAVRLTSPGPAFFRQQRVGRAGRLITLMKFRTMRLHNTGPLITTGVDGRITAVGRVLRSAKIDELPQLFNVLCGDMALVGPRPEVAEYVDLTDARWDEVLSVRPGITDPVTLRLRNEEQLLAAVDDPERFYREKLSPYKLSGYIEYIRTRSVVGDLGILAATLWAVVMGPRMEPPSVADVLRGWMG